MCVCVVSTDIYIQTYTHMHMNPCVREFNNKESKFIVFNFTKLFMYTGAFVIF